MFLSSFFILHFGTVSEIMSPNTLKCFFSPLNKSPTFMRKSFQISTRSPKSLSAEKKKRLSFFSLYI